MQKNYKTRGNYSAKCNVCPKEWLVKCRKRNCKTCATLKSISPIPTGFEESKK